MSAVEAAKTGLCEEHPGEGADLVRPVPTRTRMAFRAYAFLHKSNVH